MSLSRFQLSPVHLQAPYHLRHYDLTYATVPIDLATGCVVVEDCLNCDCPDYPDCPNCPNEYHDVREHREKNIGFVRILYDPINNEYVVFLLFSPWPAYTPDPYRSYSALQGSGAKTLSEALQGVHRLFPYYKQETLYPVPFLGSWVDYRLTASTIEAIEQEALLQGIGARSQAKTA